MLQCKDHALRHCGDFDDCGHYGDDRAPISARLPFSFAGRLPSAYGDGRNRCIRTKHDRIPAPSPDGIFDLDLREKSRRSARDDMGSGGTARLKINNNAFIASFNRAFAAASNTTGAFGNDWFQMFCEFDSIPSANSGVLEMPNTNQLLIKRSGGGAVIRMQGTTTGDGYVDLFEPLILRVRSTDPSNVQAKVFFSSATGRFRGYDGSAWRDLCFYDERNA